MSEHMNDPLEALRSMLAGVTVSPEFAADVRRRIASEPAELADVRDALAAVGPSPAFAAQVRARIESDRTSSRASLFNWRWLAASGAAAAAVVLAVLWVRGIDRLQLEVPAVPDRAQKIIRLPIVTTPPATAIPALARRLPAAPAAQASAAGESPLEVMTNQPAAIQAWMARVQSAVPVSLEAQGEQPPVQIPDVVVTPLDLKPVVVKWLVEPPVQILVPFPILRIVSADAERSPK